MTMIQPANTAIFQRFENVLTPLMVPFVFENETFSTPDGGEYIRCSIRHATSTQSSQGGIGNRRFQRTGSAFAQVFTPENTGTDRNRELVQAIVAGFEGTRIVGTTIRFNDVIPREVGPAGRFFQSVVEINFIYDEIK